VPQETSPSEYVPREYRTVVIDRSVEPLARDIFRAFSWEVTELTGGHPSPTTVDLALRRDRRIRSRELVQDLQAGAEADLGEAARLGRSIRVRAASAALLCGVAGLLLLLVAWSALVGGTGLVAALPALVGLGCVGAAPALHRLVTRTCAESLGPLQEQLGERIHESCGRAVRLLDCTARSATPADGGVSRAVRTSARCTARPTALPLGRPPLPW